MGAHLGPRPNGNAVFTGADRPITVLYNGVENPTLQWIMSAQNGSAITANATQDLSDGHPTTYTGTWISSNNGNSFSYTNSNGDTRYYFNIAGQSNFRTSFFSSDATAIIANGGFTFWITMIPYTSSSSWTRIFNYFQLASGSTGSGISSTTPNHGPCFFFNRGSTSWSIQYNRPSADSSGAPYWYRSNVGTTGTTSAVTFVITQADTGVAKIWIKLNGAQHSSYYGAVMSFSGSGAYGIKNVQNNAIAVFADSVYSNVALTGIMESGFANRP